MGTQASVRILVIPRKTLFKDEAIEGFVPIEQKNLLPLLLKSSEYQVRDETLEKNPAFKQIIPYIIVVNTRNHTVFGYKRFKKYAGLHETRLHNKFSLGLGGHIDEVKTSENLIVESMMREFTEEVKMNTYPTPKIIGFINSELSEVDRMHFAIVAIAETTENIDKRENEEVAEEKFYTIHEVDQIMQNENIQMDTWTRIVWPFVKSYLTDLKK